MIPDVQPNHLRPVNLDQTVAGGIKLSTEQGRALGLRNEQTVRGVVDESGLRVLLSTDQGTLQLALPSRAQVFMELMFRTWVTPRGFVLQPLGQAEKKAAKSSLPASSATGAAPSAVTTPATSLPSRANYLLPLQTPLGALSVFANPQALRQWANPSTGQAVERAEPGIVLPTRDNISAITIKSALTSSGLFAQQGVANQITLKTLLESAKKRLEDSRPGLSGIEMKDVVDAIDYIESAQLHAIAKQENQEVFYRFPLLFNDAPPAEASIQREKNHQQAEHDMPWRFDLELPVDEQHKVQISVQLTQGSNLNLVIWSRSEPLISLMEQELSALARQLSTWDMVLDHCQIVLGQRPPTHQSSDISAPLTGHHLDCYT